MIPFEAFAGNCNFKKQNQYNTDDDNTFNSGIIQLNTRDMKKVKHYFNRTIGIQTNNTN